MDVLTLPEPGWALGYPSPFRDNAHVMHLPCGWQSEHSIHATSAVFLRHTWINRHDCPKAVTQ